MKNSKEQQDSKTAAAAALLDIEDEDEMCPVCKSTKYLNPKMTLLVSPCYHRLCGTCINRIFLHGSAPCPLCGTILRKGNFVVATFGDLVVEREVRIRKIVSKAFYKRAEDFDTLREYNDYLEEFEDIVFNLANDVDVQSTHARLEAFKSENRDTLERNLARLANEQRQAQIAEDAGREKREKAKVAAESEKEKEIVEMMQVKQKFINDLASSSAPAAVILAEAQKTLQASKSKQSSTVPASRILRPTRTSAVPVNEQMTRKSKRTADDGVKAAAFDPLVNVIPLTTRLPVMTAELQSIPAPIALDIFAELWPPAPSSFANNPARSWNIENQMRAAGYSVDLVMKHCVRAALSWGL